MSAEYKASEWEVLGVSFEPIMPDYLCNIIKTREHLLCVATIKAAAAIFERDPKSIWITRNKDGIARAEWTRPEDGARFAIEGKLTPERASHDIHVVKGIDRLVWRYRLDTGEFGRWRDHASDPVVMVKAGGAVEILGDG